MPDLEQTLATMPLQTSLSSDNFKKFKPLLCPPVAELQRLSRNVIRCLPLSRLPSTLPVKDKNSKPLRLHTCPKNSICLFLIVFNSLLLLLLLLLRSSCSCLSDSETRCHNVVHRQGKFFCCAIEFLLQRSVVWPRSGS